MSIEQETQLKINKKIEAFKQRKKKDALTSKIVGRLLLILILSESLGIIILFEKLLLDFPFVSLFLLVFVICLAMNIKLFLKPKIICS